MGYTNGRTLTYEYCMGVAAKFNSLCGLKTGDCSVYNKCYKMGWLKKFAEMFNYMTQAEAVRTALIKRGQNKNGYKYRTDEEIIDKSREFKKLIDFRIKCPDEYQIALKRHLVPLMTWLERAKSSEAFKDTVYVYEFPETHSAYVGRSNDIERRHGEHLRKKNDSVRLHSKEHGIPIPEPKILHIVSNENDGAKLECEECDNYSNNGWNMLNRCKCGSIGRLGKFISKESAMRFARKCKYVDELRKKPRIYQFMCRNNMVNDCTWLKYRYHRKNGTYNYYETCLAEARKYKYIGDFRLKSSGAYAGAKRHGWLSRFTWLKKRISGLPRRHVAQYDYTGTILLNEFSSIKAASDTTGVDIRGISAACHKRHRKTNICRCGGFVWKFIDNTNEVDA